MNYPKLSSYNLKENTRLEMYNHKSRGNFDSHDQEIYNYLLKETASLPARNVIGIKTTELLQPVSFRFTMPSSMEDFIIKFVYVYRLCMESRVHDPEMRKIRYDMLIKKLREVLI